MNCEDKPKIEFDEMSEFMRAKGIAQNIGLPLSIHTFYANRWVDYLDAPQGKIIQLPAILREVSYSPTHQLCITTKADFVVGKGLTWDKTNRYLNSFFAHLIKDDPETSTIDDLFRKIATDYIIFNMFSVFLQFEKQRFETETDPVSGAVRIKEAEGKKVAGIVYCPNETTRLERPDKNGKFNGAYYCKDWRYRLTTNRFREIRYPLFEGRGEYPNDDIALYLYRDNRISASDYPTPYYWGAISDIGSDVDISVLRNSVLINNGMAGMVIKHAQNLSIEEQDQVAASFGIDHVGTKSAGRVMHLFGKPDKDGKVTLPDVVPLTHAANAALYDATQKQIIERICEVHKVPPSLVSFVKDNAFSDRQQLLAQVTYFEHGTIEPLRRNVLNLIRDVLNYNMRIDPNCGLSRQAIESVQFEKLDLRTLLADPAEKEIAA